MYSPHLLECAECLTPFQDQQQVYTWFEHYLCIPCTPEFIREQSRLITWHANPQDYIKKFVKSMGWA